jgi:hypothetical protein
MDYPYPDGVRVKRQADNDAPDPADLIYTYYEDDTAQQDNTTSV